MIAIFLFSIQMFFRSPYFYIKFPRSFFMTFLSIDSVTAMSQMSSQYSQLANGYYYPQNKMDLNSTMPNMVTPNFGLHQPNGEGYVYAEHQVPHSFVPGSISVEQHYYCGPRMMPNPNLRAVEPQNQEGMVCHPNGRVDHAANVLQSVGAKHAEALRHAEQADRIRATRNSLGDCIPPRAAKPYKHRLQKQGMGTRMHASNFEQDDLFSDATHGTMDGSPVAQGSNSPGRPWESYEEGLTPSQRKNSKLSQWMSISLSPPMEIRFEDPRTPQNFTHLACKKDSPGTASPSKRKNISRVRKTPTWPRLIPATSPMPLVGPARSVAISYLAAAVPSFEFLPAPAIAFSMPVRDSLVASFKPVSGCAISCPVPTDGLFGASYRTDSVPSMLFSVDIPGPTASALMSVSVPHDISCSSDIPSLAAQTSVPPSSSLIHYGAHPATPQEGDHLLSPSRSASSSMPPSSVSDIDPVSQDSHRIVDEELLFPGSNAPIAAESSAAPPPARGQNNLRAQGGTVAGTSLQEEFLLASNHDVGLDVFAGAEPSSPNPILPESQDSTGDFPDTQGGVNYFYDFGGDSEGFGFGVS
jgi:hypothetical protein